MDLRARAVGDGARAVVTPDSASERVDLRDAEPHGGGSDQRSPSGQMGGSRTTIACGMSVDCPRCSEPIGRTSTDRDVRTVFCRHCGERFLWPIVAEDAESPDNSARSRFGIRTFDIAWRESVTSERTVVETSATAVQPQSAALAAFLVCLVLVSALSCALIAQRGMALAFIVFGAVFGPPAVWSERPHRVTIDVSRDGVRIERRGLLRASRSALVVRDPRDIHSVARTTVDEEGHVRMSWLVRVLRGDAGVDDLGIIIDDAEAARFVVARLRAALARAREGTTYRD